MVSQKPTFMDINDLKTRPNAGNGLWVLFLLPLSLIVSTIKHPIILTPTYKLTSILSTGLVYTSVVIAYQNKKNQRLKIINLWTILGFLLTSGLFHICLHKDWLFSFLSGISGTLMYFQIYKSVLKIYSECFTLGEAGLVSQALIIVCYSTVIHVTNFSGSNSSNIQKATLIIQIGLFGVGIIALAAYLFKYTRSVTSFYPLVFTVITFIIFLPLHILLDASPVLWILNLIFADISVLKLIFYWSFCTGIAVLAVSNQILYARKASTGMRKVFHVLAVVVYIPGLLYQCSFLYLASGVVLGLFFALEIVRVLNIPPLGDYLQDGFAVFSDEKDTGNLALTPIYLMVGCSLPLWIHPSPCDVTDSAMFNILPLISGLLSIGAGDTAASIVGSNFGKHFWTGSKKTIEGTIACIIAQVGLIHILTYFGCVQNLSNQQYTKAYLAIFVTSLVEAKTTQVDNLVLPLIMYTLLI